MPDRGLARAGSVIADGPGTVLRAARVFLQNLVGDGPLVVAVSGGGDSLALLLALHDAKRADPRLDRSLHAVTVDHGLRPGSAEEAGFVARLCATIGVPHTVRRWDGAKPATGIQATARLARYRLLWSEVERLSGIAVATAHTADDQAETVAMRVGRSSGDAATIGLSGMAPATLFERRGWILRPFLHLRRSALRTFLTARGQSWIDDPSNVDVRFERARVRAAVPEPMRHVAASDRQDLSQRAAAVITGQASLEAGAVVRLKLDDLAPGDPAVEHALRTLVAAIGGRSHRPGSSVYDRLADLLERGGDVRLTLGRCVVVRKGATLRIHRERRGLPTAVLPPGETCIWDGRFDVSNTCEWPVRVRPPRPNEIAKWLSFIEPGLCPRGIMRDAFSAEPVVDEVVSDAAVRSHVRLERHIALFDVFLPSFDQRLADSCAALFGREPYGVPPLRRR